VRLHEFLHLLRGCRSGEAVDHVQVSVRENHLDVLLVELGVTHPKLGSLSNIVSGCSR
jgi:hypothetical protein